MSNNGDSNKPGSTCEPIWMGVGSPRPQPRVKQNSMFGHVVDAFDEKSIVKIGEVTPFEKRKKAQEAAERAEAEACKEREAAAADAAMMTVPAVAVPEGEPPHVDAVETVEAVDSLSADDAASKTNSSGLLIKGGRIVNHDRSFESDVYIENDRIKIVDSVIPVPAGTRTIDAKGKLIIPGGIDTSTHLQAPFNGTVAVDDFYHGTMAALFGGTTMIVDCVIPEKGQSLLASYDKWFGWANDNVCCDYSFRVLVSSWNEHTATEMETLAKEKGVNTFVVSMGCEDMSDDTTLYQIFKHCRKIGAVVQIIAENESITLKKARELFDEGMTGPEGHLLSRPEEVEAEAVNRAITLASQAGVPVYISNVTSRSSAAIIEKNRRKGKAVFAEPLLASLAVDGSHYFNTSWRHAAGYVTNPPLRIGPDNRDYLVSLLANGELQTVGSDHRTFNAEQKALGKDDFRKIPPGVNGLSERLSIVWENGVAVGKMDPCRFVAVTSTNAAKLYNLYPKKGHIAVGSDADLVVWDADDSCTFSAKTHHNKCDFNIFEDMTCHGVAKYVIKGGQVVLDEDGCHATKGSGHFASNDCNSEFAYSKIWSKEKAETFEPVARDPYESNASGTNKSTSNQTNVPSMTGERVPGEMYTRPPTRSGGRNMQDSTFALGGVSKTANGEDPIKTQKGGGYRVNQPPGGTSTQLW